MAMTGIEAMTLQAKLAHALTAYDRRCEAAARRAGRHHNQYALGHYLGAVERIMADIARGMTVRAAIVVNLNDRPLDVVLKAAGEPKATLDEIRGRSR